MAAPNLTRLTRNVKKLEKPRPLKISGNSNRLSTIDGRLNSGKWNDWCIKPFFILCQEVPGILFFLDRSMSEDFYTICMNFLPHYVCMHSLCLSLLFTFLTSLLVVHSLE